MKKLDLNDIEVIFPENLNQLLIWTSELAQHNHTQFIKFSNKLKYFSFLNTILQILHEAFPINTIYFYSYYLFFRRLI